MIIESKYNMNVFAEQQVCFEEQHDGCD
jgi:hypothetical protein